MPIEQNKYRIKDLNAINQEAQLIDKIIEVESSVSDENFRVSVPTLVQTVANNLPGANNAKSGYKMVRFYDANHVGYREGDSTLVSLNPAFLCLGTICKAEFPGKEYILVYSQTGPLTVWLDGTFVGDRITAKWVEKDSLEDQVKGIVDFNPFQASYDEGDTVKFVVDTFLRLFVARKELVKSEFSDNQIPVPTGLSTDENWREVNPAGLVKIKDWLEGSYKKHEVVVYQGQLLRAKHDIAGTFVSVISELPPAPSEEDWEFLSGGGGGAYVYDDTVLQNRLGVVEDDVDTLRIEIAVLDASLTGRIDDIVAVVSEWVPGSYIKGQLVSSGGNVFSAKQNIQNSQVAPTATNLYWLKVNGAGDVTQQYVDTADAALDARIDVLEGQEPGTLLTPDQQNALSGTNGTPSAANRFVTNQDPRIGDSRRKIFARKLSGEVYEGTAADPAADRVHLAADFVGNHGLIEVNTVYDSTGTINLRQGTTLLGNMRYFRLGSFDTNQGFDLNLAPQTVLRDLKIENYWSGYVRSAYGANNYQTPRIDGCTFFSKVKVEAGCFLRIVDCIINDANGWNVGDGTILLEGSTRSFSGSFGVGPGFATIIDLRPNAESASKDYVDIADAALDARIDALETSPVPTGDVTQAELNAEISARVAGDAALDGRVDDLESVVSGIDLSTSNYANIVKLDRTRIFYATWQQALDASQPGDTVNIASAITPLPGGTEVNFALPAGVTLNTNSYAIGSEATTGPLFRLPTGKTIINGGGSLAYLNTNFASAIYSDQENVDLTVENMTLLVKESGAYGILMITNTSTVLLKNVTFAGASGGRAIRQAGTGRIVAKHCFVQASGTSTTLGVFTGGTIEYEGNLLLNDSSKATVEQPNSKLTLRNGVAYSTTRTPGNFPLIRSTKEAGQVVELTNYSVLGTPGVVAVQGTTVILRGSTTIVGDIDCVTLVDERPVASAGVAQSYVDAADAAMDARIDTLESAGSGSVTITGASVQAVVNSNDADMRAALDGSGNLLFYHNDNRILSAHIADGNVTTNKLQNLGITNEKIADNSILSGKLDATYRASVLNRANHTGTQDAGTITTGTFATARIPSLPASQINSGTLAAARFGASTITVDKLSATGTRSATTYLRGDGAWASVTAASQASVIPLIGFQATPLYCSTATDTLIDGTDFLWNAAYLPAGRSVYLEMVGRSDSFTSALRMSLYDLAGNPVTGFAQNADQVYGRSRSAALTLVDGTTYRVYLRMSNGSAGSIKLARLIIL
ncbi:hypothetical protein [Hymenobacter canadensis]|uniref:DUF1983 domain-containing protein n=1 Tax=Hymenobacter canadensis TaxID=2999067 RepID=A0ABY7LRX0_9BACT|nr:hypothetical protein [Hymenobacter canadensis]WBA43161.1 hypothetical protein O3303_06250 [Hymenobacter canadensis]